jgi:protein TonB
MSNIYGGGGGSRRALVFGGIVLLHFGFYLALVSGLAREAVQVLADVGIVDLPPPPPPPEDLEEPPPPPPIDRPPPVVPPPLIDLPAFEGPSQGITNVQVTDRPAAPAPVVGAPAQRPVQVTPPTPAYNARALASALNRCYPSASRRLNEEGRVVATITIGTDGRMKTLQVQQSSGFERLDGAAECVVRNLKFNPGKRDGVPIEAQATLPISFVLE